MTTSATALPRQAPLEVSASETFAGILAWIAYLGLAFFPRACLLGSWIFLHLLGDAFTSWVVPALGFILLPWTTLTYACLWAIGSDTVSGWEWIVVVTALLLESVFWAWTRSAFK